MISRGVPAEAIIPVQLASTREGPPVSEIVGQFGVAAAHLVAAIPISLISLLST